MKIDLKAGIKGLFGQSETDARSFVQEAQQHLQEMEKESLVEELLQGGHINADTATREAVAKLAATDPEAVRFLLTASKPAPAAGSVQVLNPNVSTDPTQAAIEATMKEKSIPYHEAALQVSEGADLQP